MSTTLSNNDALSSTSEDSDEFNLEGQEALYRMVMGNASSSAAAAGEFADDEEGSDIVADSAVGRQRDTDEIQNDNNNNDDEFEDEFDLQEEDNDQRVAVGQQKREESNMTAAATISSSNNISSGDVLADDDDDDQEDSNNNNNMSHSPSHEKSPQSAAAAASSTTTSHTIPNNDNITLQKESIAESRTSNRSDLENDPLSSSQQQQQQQDNHHSHPSVEPKEEPKTSSPTTAIQSDSQPTEPAADASSTDPLQQARLQWAQVNQLREKQGYGKEASGHNAPEEAPIRSSDAYDLLQKQPNFPKLLQKIQEESESDASSQKQLMHWISKFTFGACGATPIKSKALDLERKQLLATCKVDLDLGDVTHIRIMGTIYRRLTGSRFNCPMVGSHWETLGFQRPNPQTDLRDAGMFGMVQLLSFLEQGKDVPLNLLRMSQTVEHDFPFCVVSLNMTGITKSLLRAGKLNFMINKKRNVLEAMNLAYMSIFYDFYLTWKSEGGKNIHQYGGIKKQLEKKAEKNIEKLIASFEKDILSGPFAGVQKQEF